MLSLRPSKKMMHKNLFLFFLFIIIAIVQVNADDSSSATRINSAKSFYIKRTAGNGVPMYFSISDTQPTIPVYSPHMSMSYGDPENLHAMVSLESNESYGESKMVAVFGIINNGGEFNATILADTAAGEFIRIQAKNEQGRGKYKFTPSGIDFSRNQSEGAWFLSNAPGHIGNVLQYTANDTARFQMFVQENIDSVSLYAIQKPVKGQTAYCLDCTPIETAKGVMVTFNDKAWCKSW